MTVRILKGDCRDVLRTLEDESVHCVVTSPPYWGLRDYGVEGQIGLEQSMSEHVRIMRGLFSEVRRVLRKDGTLWLNYGDCYVTSPPGNKPGTTKDSSGLPNSRENLEMRRAAQVKVSRVGASGNKGNGAADHGIRVTTDGLYDRRMALQIGQGEDKEAIWGIKVGSGLKNKDLCGVPWRVAFALQDDGWYLRQDIIWHKPNPMPESIKDRCTKAHEYIFLLSKSQRYFYDADAIAEPLDRPEESERKTPAQFGGANKHVEAQKQSRLHSGNEYTGTPTGKRNKRSVWTIASQAFSEAHFATFPPSLIEPCILAGCPVGGTVLDPFGGAGTTGLVADRLGRNAILIELNPEYADMAERRIANDAGMFASVEMSAADQV